VHRVEPLSFGFDLEAISHGSASSNIKRLPNSVSAAEQGYALTLRGVFGILQASLKSDGLLQGLHGLPLKIVIAGDVMHLRLKNEASIYNFGSPVRDLILFIAFYLILVGFFVADTKAFQARENDIILLI
jgi:hypothetical protein